MDKTISELAEELSISRQAIHQSLDKLFDKKKLKKEGNKYLINKEQQKKIYEYFCKTKKEGNTSIEDDDSLMIILQDQNKFLREELENKNKQIQELHILLLKEKTVAEFLTNKPERKKENKNSFFGKLIERIKR